MDVVIEKCTVSTRQTEIKKVKWKKLRRRCLEIGRPIDLLALAKSFVSGQKMVEYRGYSSALVVAAEATFVSCGFHR